MPVYKENGSWSFIASIKNQAFHRRGFSTAKEAKAAEAAFILSNPKGKLKNIAVKDLCASYIAQQKHTLKQTSVYDLERILNKHILPIFGDMDISKVTPLMINNWRNTLYEANYSFSYLKKLYGTFKTIYKYACIYYDISVNPFSKLPNIKRTTPKKERPFYTKEQFDKLYQALPDDLIYKVMFRTFFFLGLRLGELQALQWKDVDFIKKEISINKTYSRFKNGKNRLGKTKTASSNATITVPNSLMPLYKQLHNYQKEKYKAGNLSDFVFGIDSPISDKTIDRVFHKASQTAGLPKITIHGLRHSCGSYYLSIGVPIEVVSKILRHSNIGITMQVYLHVKETRVSDVLSKINVN